MIVRPDFTTLSCLAATFAIGLMVLATTDIASAETVVRDHRGASGAPSGGVTVNGKAGKVTKAPEIGCTNPKKCKPVTYDKLKESGVTVRDHRTKKCWQHYCPPANKK